MKALPFAYAGRYQRYMNHDAALIADLTVGLSFAWFAGFIAVRLRLNPIIGYIVAGIVIGPFTPGFVAHAQIIEGLATLGLVFLLFSLGLEFSFNELRKSGLKTVSTNAFATAVATAIAWVGFGLSHMKHPFTAALCTAVSSTAVSVALLKDWKSEGEGASHFAITQQVVQDFFAIVLLVITTIPLVNVTPVAIAYPLLKATIFVATAIFIGYTVMKVVVKRILDDSSTERLFIAFAAISLISASLGKYFGLSYEFGAFVAGAVITGATGSKMIVSIVAPFRAIFVALFFVSIGMLFNPKSILSHAALIVLIGSILVILRFVIWHIVGIRHGHETKISALAAVAMTAMGEFNAVLANEAIKADRIDTDEQQILLGIILFSIFSVLMVAPHVPHWLHRLRKPMAPEGEVRSHEPVVAIIGFGRVGQAIGHVLRDAGVHFTALEAHRALIDIARKNGFDVVFGEPLDPVALDRVILPSTRIVVTTVAEAHVNMAVCEHVFRRYDVEVIARAGHGSDIEQLIDQRGAALAFVPENEGALVFARAVLESLEFEGNDIERYIEEERLASRGLAVSMEHDHHHLFNAVHMPEL